MIIKKFQGKTEEEATALAREELGKDAVVMNVKEIKPRGMLKAFKSSVFEVTAALEEETESINPKAMMSPLHMHETSSNAINMVANEPIRVPALAREEPMSEKTSGLEEKIESLQSLLEKKLAPEESLVSQEDSAREDKLEKENAPVNEGFRFLKLLYSTLLDNEVNEKYVNQIMDEIEKVMRNGSSVDYILSNIYQKMILKLGQPQTIDLTGEKPRVIFFIGPTGVGKTTTLAKIASRLRVGQGKKVALMTADTYRIAAAEQLRTYANILDTPLTIVYSVEELNEAVGRVLDYDVVLVDTAGFSHHNQEQRNDVKKLVDNLDPAYQKEVYLVLSATTKYRDLLEIADVYRENFDFRMIFTKLDETSCYGNIYNMKMYTGADLSYTTNGQNVPDDIEVFDTQKMVKLMLGGK